MLISLSALLSQFILLCCASIMLGVAMVSMNIAWGVIAVAQGVRKALLNTAGAWTLGFLINTLTQCLVPVAQEVLIALFPLISMALYVLNASLQSRKQYCVLFVPMAASKERLPKSVARTAAVVLVFCLAFGLMYGTTIFLPVEGTSVSVFAALGMRGFGALVLFGAGLLLPKKHFAALVGAFVLAAILGVVLIPAQMVVGGLQDAICLIISLGYVGSDVAAWMLMAFACTGSTSHNARIVAWIVGSQQVGILVGHLCAPLLGSVNVASSTPLLLVSLYLFIFASVALVKICSDALIDGRNAHSVADEDINSSGDQNLDDALKAFARSYGLTSRELEVVCFIVQGRSVPYIAQALTLSDNTVKTHIRHVYTKSGVHNRQEFLDLIVEKKQTSALSNHQ